MSDKTEVVLFRTPYVVDKKTAEECRESALAAMKEDAMDDKSNINYIHPFTHKNIMNAWKKMLEEYGHWIMQNDFVKANEIKTKMDGLVSSLATKAGE